jgi:hypothetical protein
MLGDFMPDIVTKQQTGNPAGKNRAPAKKSASKADEKECGVKPDREHAGEHTGLAAGLRHLVQGPTRGRRPATITLVKSESRAMTSTTIRTM